MKWVLVIILIVISIKFGDGQEYNISDKELIEDIWNITHYLFYKDNNVTIYHERSLDTINYGIPVFERFSVELLTEIKISNKI